MLLEKNFLIQVIWDLLYKNRDGFPQECHFVLVSVGQKGSDGKK